MGTTEMPAVQRDRLLPISGIVAVLAVLGVFADYVHPFEPKLLLWLPSVVGPVLPFLACLRTAGTATLPDATRRFWRHLAVAVGFIGIGVAAQPFEAMAADDPGKYTAGPIMLAFCTVGVGTVMYALFRLPLGEQAPGELLRVFLDAGTVMVAAAIFVWHYATRDALDDSDHSAVYTSLFVTVIALLAVFAVAKFVLSSHRFVDNGALRVIAAAMLIGAIGPMLGAPLAAVDPSLVSEMACTPVVFFLATLAAGRQREAGLGTRRGVVTPKRRSFSLLPYAAVAAVDGLLIVVTLGNDDGEAAVVGAAVLTTALVLLRQLTAFRDNSLPLLRLDHGATHDALTQLPNRVLFHTRLRAALTGVTGRPVAVALIDLDDFKEVNDTLGHHAGDLLLIEVAARLAGAVRQADTVARLGGDEFAILLPGVDSVDNCLELARRLLDAVQGPAELDGVRVDISGSIGAAVYPMQGATSTELLQHADIAMYAAKRARSGTALYDAEDDSRSALRLGLIGELHRAIAESELVLHYQPKVATDSGRTIGVEALVRWQHPTRGLLPPGAFIPQAEDDEIIVALTDVVLELALRQHEQWRAAGTIMPVSVNIAAGCLADEAFPDRVAAALVAHRMSGDLLTLEITETSIIKDPGEVRAMLLRLRALGVELSIDDFGTGFSSMAYLQTMPLTELKIDPRFIKDVHESARDHAIVRAVLDLGQALHLTVVAEGVEDAAALAVLVAMGCPVAQGYHLALPLPAADVLEWTTAAVG